MGENVPLEELNTDPMVQYVNAAAAIMDLSETSSWRS
jgi:hypothetical protein